MLGKTDFIVVKKINRNKMFEPGKNKFHTCKTDVTFVKTDFTIR